MVVDLSSLTKLIQPGLYLQVISLTDITSADGHQIIPQCKLEIPPPDCRITLNWPEK
jgi:hypothetical protein